MSKPKTVRASFRFNALRYLVLLGSLLGAYGLVRGAMWDGTETHLATFMYTLAGGLLAAAAKTAIDIFNWADTARQHNHVQRIGAVHRVFQRAKEVRTHALIDWRRIHTVIVDNLSGTPREIRLFDTHDETDKEAEGLVKNASTEELWIRAEGVEAVKRFKAAIATIDYKAFPAEEDFLAMFNAYMDTLRHDLALAAVGIPLD